MTRVSEDDRKAKKTGRLAAALRENLRRRKAQERARDVVDKAERQSEPAGEDKDR